jgi:hypothetical protein
MIDMVISKNAVPIRLTDERWAHIVEEHAEMAGRRLEVLETISHPKFIFAGGVGELLATREVEAGKFLVVVYREAAKDGFVITAFLTRRLRYLERREKLWP